MRPPLTEVRLAAVVAMAEDRRIHARGDNAGAWDAVLELSADNAHLRTRLDSERHARLEAERRLAEAVEVLRDVEWEGSPRYRNTSLAKCLVCQGRAEKGHAEGCRLARVIREGT